MTHIASPRVFLSLLLSAALLAACSENQSTVLAATRAGATAELLGAKGEKIGTAELRQTPAGVEIEMKVFGLTPGVHALHIHNTGDCHTPGPDGKVFSAAGAHFNPFGKQHGLENPKGPHAGDLPNFTVAADGSALVKVVNSRVTLDDGKANSLFQPGETCLVIHEKADDGTSDPAGDSGERVACGAIKKKK